MSATLSVSAVDGIDALVRFSSEIDRFNLASQCPNPFLSSQYLRCYAEHSEYHVPGAEERLFLIREGERLIGCAPMRRTTDTFNPVAGPLGLRGVGLGGRIVRELERRARAAGVRELILLTETARPFFEQQHYRAIERTDVPAAVRASEEFRSLCPASAACMSRTLTGANLAGTSHG